MRSLTTISWFLNGFHSYRLPYYGELECNGHKYDCRLEEYKAYYNTAIRLYKLHGSLDYLMFKRCDSNGCFWNDNMIKIPYGIGVDKTKKQNKKRLGYIMDWIEYNHFQEQSPKFTIIMIVSTRNCSNDLGIILIRQNA